jgi:uncharacterized protein (TIGR02246 family)
MSWTHANAMAIIFLFSISFSGSRTQAQSKSSDADTAAIKQGIAAYTAAFNRNDAHAQAMTFTEDADLTNTRGMFYHGRKDIEARFAFNFSGRYKGAHRTDTVKKIWMLTPELALVQADWEMMGAKADDGSEIAVRKGLISPVMKKENGQWLISIFHESEFQTPAAK